MTISSPIRTVELLDAESIAGLKKWDQPDFGGRKAGEPPAPPVMTAADLENVQQQAYREAFEQGHAEGLAKGREDVDKEIAHIKSLVSTMVRPFADLDNEISVQLLRVATRLAEQLLRRELSQDPADLERLVRETVEVIADETRSISIRMHPEDAAAAEAWLGDAGESGWRLLADAALDRGDVQIQGDAMRVDARVQTRLTELARSLQVSD